MKQSQENKPDPKLEKMIERSREIGREIEKQAQEIDKSLVTDRPNLTGYLEYYDENNHAFGFWAFSIHWKAN